jgi:hypothetical protein
LSLFLRLVAKGPVFVGFRAPEGLRLENSKSKRAENPIHHLVPNVRLIIFNAILVQ